MKNLLSTIVLANGLLLGASALAQTCSTDVNLTKPDDRYTVNSNGTVTDNKTDLIWQACSVGETYDADAATCTGAPAGKDWQAAFVAVQDANTNRALGYSDWRLPSIAELRTLTDKACTSPAINTTVFPTAGNNSYWSSSASVRSVHEAWSINFTTGVDGYEPKTRPWYVRLVRGGH